MPSLLDTPVELQNEILSHLLKSDLKSVRLSCKELSSKAKQFQFRDLSIKMVKTNTVAISEKNNRQKELLKVISHKDDSEIARNVHSLSILRPAVGSLGTDTTTQGHLTQALRRMSRLETVRWNCGETPWWMQDALAFAIATNSRIENLELELNQETTIDICSFQHISSLIIHYATIEFALNKVSHVLADLTQLSSFALLGVDIENSNPDSNLMVQDLFKPLLGKSSGKPSNLVELGLQGVDLTSFPQELRHLFRNLKNLKFDFYSLTIGDFGWASMVDFEELWDGLREAGIHLTSLTTSDRSDALNNYLSSYSTLKVLILNDEDGGLPHGAQDCAAVARNFWIDVLPHHYDSLELLDVCSSFYASWNFNSTCANSLFQCKKLKTLIMGVDSATQAHQLLLCSAKIPKALEALWIMFPPYQDEQLIGELKLFLCSPVSSFQPKRFGICSTKRRTKVYARTFNGDCWSYKEIDDYGYVPIWRSF